MSDPHDIPGRKQPPRAQPLQPDKPGSGDGRTEEEHSSRKTSQDTAERQRLQSETALDNVREGYG